MGISQIKKIYIRFFKSAVENVEKRESRKIYIIEDTGEKVGHLYIIPEDKDIFELATAICTKY